MKKGPQEPRFSPPSGLAVARQIALLSLRRARRSLLLRATALLLLLPILASVGAAFAGSSGAAFFETMLDLFLRYLVPILLAFHSSNSVAEEVQRKTITYLYSRPIPRWSLPVGKYMGAVAVMALLICVALCCCYLATMFGEGARIFSELPLLAAGLVSVTLGTLYYGALAAAFGAMVTSAPFAIMLIYTLAMDVGMSFVPGWIKVISMTVHLRVIAGLYRPAQTVFISDPSLTASVSLPVLLAVTAFWLGLAISVAVSSEYRIES